MYSTIFANCGDCILMKIRIFQPLFFNCSVRYNTEEKHKIWYYILNNIPAVRGKMTHPENCTITAAILSYSMIYNMHNAISPQNTIVGIFN